MSKPRYNVGDLVTRASITSMVLIYTVDEVLESAGTFLYYLTLYRGPYDTNGMWDWEDNLVPVKKMPVFEAVPWTLRVCDALCLSEVLTGRQSVVVDLDDRSAVEYHFKPVGAVHVLHMRNLDLGLDKSGWTPAAPTRESLEALCRTADYPSGEGILRLAARLTP